MAFGCASQEALNILNLMQPPDPTLVCPYFCCCCCRRCCCCWQAVGLRVIRTWMFNIGLPKARATYDARQLAGLDYIMWSCKQRGIMLLLALGNLWPAYKGPEEFLQ